MHAAVAAGVHPDIRAAAAAMGRVRRDAYVPDPARADAYDELYAHYSDLHDRFGRDGERDAQPAAPAHARGERVSADIAALRRTLCELHAELPRNGLVAWTSGNLSARVPGEDLMVIKPSGLSYDELTPEAMVVCDLDGERVDGDLRRPATPRRTATSTGRCRRSAASRTRIRPTRPRGRRAAEPIPCVLTAMADEFGGPIPVGPFALIGDEEIGRGIVETLAGSRSTAVLMRSHGVFTVGPGPREAIKAAVMCEDVARTVHLARALGEVTSIWRQGGARRSMTATRTSTDSAKTRGRRASAAADRAAGDHAGPLRRHAAGHHRAPGGVRARARRARSADVAEVVVAPPSKDRADAERAMRELESSDLDGAARRDAHVRAGDAGGARCWRRPAADLPRQRAAGARA